MSTRPRPRFTDVVLDPGHGGIDPESGEYVTAPSKMYVFTRTKEGDPIDPPLTHYEGQWTRVGCSMLATMLKGARVRCWSSLDGDEIIEWPRPEAPAFTHADVSLTDRVRFADRIERDAHARGGRSLVVSVHSNAAGSSDLLRMGGGSDASGISVYTSIGQTDADTVADALYDAYLADPQMPFRVRRGDFSDGDRDHEAGFYVLRKTVAAAVLVEGGFHTNLADARRLQTITGQLSLSVAAFRALLPFLVRDDGDPVQPIYFS